MKHLTWSLLLGVRLILEFYWQLGPGFVMQTLSRCQSSWKKKMAHPCQVTPVKGLWHLSLQGMSQGVEASVSHVTPPPPPLSQPAAKSQWPLVIPAGQRWGMASTCP